MVCVRKLFPVAQGTRLVPACGGSAQTLDGEQVCISAVLTDLWFLMVLFGDCLSPSFTL